MSNGKLREIHDRELEQKHRNFLYLLGLVFVIALVMIAIALSVR